MGNNNIGQVGPEHPCSGIHLPIYFCPSLSLPIPVSLQEHYSQATSRSGGADPLSDQGHSESSPTSKTEGVLLLLVFYPKSQRKLETHTGLVMSQQAS